MTQTESRRRLFQTRDRRKARRDGYLIPPFRGREHNYEKATVTMKRLKKNNGLRRRREEEEEGQRTSKRRRRLRRRRRKKKKISKR